ncbi:hypothetical protein KEM52_001915 [Ascosphaera acerosa]|nr:hypothetical protein KEM52_001915 [Ascosphaera acerosa]
MAIHNGQHDDCLRSGPPGSGKGTLCAKLADENGLLHFSVPEYTRQMSCLQSSRRASDRAAQILQTKRKLLLDERLSGLVKEKLHREISQGSERIVVEGFPRDLSQALSIESEPSRLPRPDVVICLKCPKARARARYVGRGLVEDQAFNEQVFDKQYRDFELKEKTLKDFYRNAGILLEAHSGMGILSAYNKLMSKLKDSGIMLDGPVEPLQDGVTTASQVDQS